LTAYLFLNGSGTLAVRESLYIQKKNSVIHPDISYILYTNHKKYLLWLGNEGYALNY